MALEIFKICWKARACCTRAFQILHILKCEVLNWRICSRPALPRLTVSRPPVFLTAEESAGWFWLLWPLLGSPPGQLCYQLHITGLHQHTYYMYQIKYVPRGNITDISFFFLFRGSVMLHCGCSELLQLVTKGRDLIVWWKMKIRYWAVSFLSANFFFFSLR